MIHCRAFAFTVLLLGAAAPVNAHGQSNHTAGKMTSNASYKPTRSGYAPVNGLQLYYEVYGGQTTGVPLVLLHGGGSTIGTNFGRVIPLLGKNRQLIAVEFQAHGHTRDIDRPFTFAQDAEDVAALLALLHVPKADVLGFSNGGSTALQVAIRHPKVVNRIVTIASIYKRDGMPAEFWDFMQKGTFADMPQVYKDEYLKINPSQEGVRAMYERDSRRMIGFADWPDADIRSIQAPTLVVVGDRDVVRPEHALEMSRLLPHGRLSILPGTHGEYMGEIMTPNVHERVPQLFVALVEEFLSAGR